MSKDTMTIRLYPTQLNLIIEWLDADRWELQEKGIMPFSQATLGELIADLEAQR